MSEKPANTAGRLSTKRRSDRSNVADLRAAIAAGTYRLDPDRLAAALIAADVLDPERTR